MTLIKRTIGPVCRDAFKKYPIITITGPRQSGKTTLAKSLFPKMPYVNMEFPDDRRLAIEDPRGFLNNYPEGAILDEIQRTPELPSYLQGIVDEKKKNGMFVLTGSQQFEISQSITQSLAGRTAMIKLLPFTIEELYGPAFAGEVDTVMLNGFYPGLHINKINSSRYYSNYLETYIERDLRQLSQIENLTTFEKFVRLLASRAGSLLNASSIANDCGVSMPTIGKWLSLLEASYIVFLLPPFFRNIGKRLIKSPKIYFHDTGLLCFLLGIENESHLKSHPLRGNIF
jgi:predicted AAA+ superfamily ATPase